MLACAERSRRAWPLRSQCSRLFSNPMARFARRTSRLAAVVSFLPAVVLAAFVDRNFMMRLISGVRSLAANFFQKKSELPFCCV